MTTSSARLLRIVSFLVMPFALLVCPAHGQTKSEKGSAGVEGTVRDSQSHPLAGATVSLQHSGAGQTLDVKTDSNGHFRFEAIPGGTYALHAKMPGYRELSKRDVVHAENEKTSVDLVLEKDSAPQTQKFAAQPMEYSDRPEFTVAGLTDPTNLGGHGSEVIVRTREELAKETASLNRGASESMKPGSPTSNFTEQDVRALLAHEDRAELHESLGDIEEGEGHPLEAVREYERAAEMQPSEGYLFAWGAELLLHRAPEPAGEVFAKGHRLFPRSVRMLQGLGVASYDRGSYERAVEQLLKACDMDPANPNSYSFLFKIQNAEKVEIPGWTERLRRFVDFSRRMLSLITTTLLLWQKTVSSRQTESRSSPCFRKPSSSTPVLAMRIFNWEFCIPGKRTFRRRSPRTKRRSNALGCRRKLIFAWRKRTGKPGKS